VQLQGDMCEGSSHVRRIPPVASFVVGWVDSKMQVADKDSFLSRAVVVGEDGTVAWLCQLVK
jgi:hypothetical protein